MWIGAKRVLGRRQRSVQRLINIRQIVVCVAVVVVVVVDVDVADFGGWRKERGHGRVRRHGLGGQAQADQVGRQAVQIGAVGLIVALESRRGR